MKLNKTKLKLGAASLLVVTVLGAGVYYGTMNTGKNNNEAQSVIIHTDHKTYDSVDALVKDANVVVIAEAVSVGPTTLEKLEGAPSDEEAKKAGKTGGGSYPTTPVMYNVSQVIKGQTKVGDYIKTNELGGKVGEVAYKIEGQEFGVAQGKKYLLFLLSNDVGELSPLPAGSQARYLIRNGSIVSSSNERKGAEEQLHSMTVEEFINSIK